MRIVTIAVPLLVVSGCKGPPARLVAGMADTVIVNTQRPIQLPVRVLDAAGHVLRDTGVRYQWTSGVPVTVSATGVATCMRPGDATVRASLGPLSTQLLLRCRPVREIRALRVMNLVVGDSAQELPFEAVGVDGHPVTLLRARITVHDTSIVALEGERVRARAPGGTGVTIRVGDREAFTVVQVYQRVPTPEGIRPGELLAVPVRLAGGEMHRWRLSASRELYFLAMLPEGDEHQMPRLAVVGASCDRMLGAHHFACLAQQDAWVFVYNPHVADSSQKLNGTLAVRRQGFLVPKRQSASLSEPGSGIRNPPQN